MAIRRPGIFAALSAYYFDDDAIMEAGEDAELLYVRMLAYASRQLETEGFISDRVLVSRLGILPRETGSGTGTEPGTDAGSRAHKLADVGLIDREDDGWRIRSWLKWNRSAEEMGKERARDRIRKRTPDKDLSGNDTGSRAGTDAGNGVGSQPGKVRESQRNDQTRPDQTNPSLRSGGAGGGLSEQLPVPLGADSATEAAPTDKPKTKRGTRIPAGWQPARTDANVNAEDGLDVSRLRLELDKFRDYWTAKTGAQATKLDWDATWRNWIRNAKDRAPRQPKGRASDMTGDDWDQIMAAAAAKEAEAS